MSPDGGLAGAAPAIRVEGDAVDARIVVVDDQPGNLAVLRRLLSHAGYRNVNAIEDPEEAVDACRRQPPDLMLLDLHMPVLDGFGVLAALQTARADEGHFPVIILTADTAMDSRLRALSAGADDFLSKPLDPLETLLRVKNQLETRDLQQMLLNDRARLEVTVQERTADLELARTEVLQRLALASEYRDDETQEHAQRIGLMSALVARGAGCDEEQVRLIERAASLHDIGKIAVPDAILLKPGRLTQEEFAAMKEHTTRGAEILAGSSSPLLQLAEVIARSHHERWDGTGYPEGLAGERIPRAARMVSLVDVFDALVHDRPYKQAWPVAEALAEIRRGSGTQFDPELLEIFMTLDHDQLATA